jgi:hypothetical protein
LKFWEIIYEHFLGKFIFNFLNKIIGIWPINLISR